MNKRSRGYDDARREFEQQARKILVVASAVSIMIGAVLVVYVPIGLLSGKSTLTGMDYEMLHANRIEYAQRSLANSPTSLPGWHTRELFGSPFWSNVQNFPFLPSRLFLLLFDSSIAFPIGINIAAVAAAIFTFLFCRQIGISHVSAAVAGWTFACSGFFAARIMAGHLPFLEAYPSLPAMLWLVERAIHSNRRMGFRFDLLWISAGSFLVVLAGHPQLPFYTLLSTSLYVVWRMRRRAFEYLASMAFGMGGAMFVWYPMLLLIGRSTRILDLDPAVNYIAFPYGRLWAFVNPWGDGWPQMVNRFPHDPFDYPNAAFFWDTVCYVGILPIAALIYVIVRRYQLQRRFEAAVGFLLVLGGLALFLALPWVQSLPFSLPGTSLRSPARQLYLTTFALAVVAGVACDQILAINKWGNGWKYAMVGGMIVFHVVDLGWHDRAFLSLRPRRVDHLVALNDELSRRIGANADGQRVGVDTGLFSRYHRSFDDVGFFDSIMLAPAYKALLSLGERPETTNAQLMDVSTLSNDALAYASVAVLISEKTRSDLRPITTVRGIDLYEIPDAARRAAFFDGSSIEVVAEEVAFRRLREQKFDNRLLLTTDEPENLSVPAAPPADKGNASLVYERTSPDKIKIEVSTSRSGFVRILEAWDPGWIGSVGGEPCRVIRADGFCMAVPVDSGSSTVILRYKTPGFTTGCLIAIVCWLGVFTLAFWRRRAEPVAEHKDEDETRQSSDDPDLTE